MQIRVWKKASGKCHQYFRLKGHKGMVTCCQFLGAANVLVTR